MTGSPPALAHPVQTNRVAPITSQKTTHHARPPILDPPADADADASSPDVTSNQRHNFVVLTLYHVVLRIGWIFKTESIVMPAVLDSIGGTATLRGMLPMLSRFAMAIPRVIAAPIIRRTKQKKNALAIFTALMGLSFLTLASCWLVPGKPFHRVLPYLFLAIYTLFFVWSGLNALCFGTLQGKVIPVRIRGRLMLASNVVGSIASIAFLILLMPGWLSHTNGQFQFIFGFSGLAFLFAGCVALRCREADDLPQVDSEAVHHDGFRRVFTALQQDPHLRRIALVSALGSCSIMLFPHYQALARQRMDATYHALLPWIAVQNIGTALFSLLSGPIADAAGNRRVLQGITWCMVGIPLLALTLTRINAGSFAFSCVFFFVGITPIFLRIVQHYTLELTTRSNHPRYLAAVALCTAVPFLLSGGVGYAVDQVGFDLVFLAISIVVAFSALLTLRMKEPRNIALPPACPASHDEASETKGEIGGQ